MQVMKKKKGMESISQEKNGIKKDTKINFKRGRQFTQANPKELSIMLERSNHDPSHMILHVTWKALLQSHLTLKNRHLATISHTKTHMHFLSMLLHEHRLPSEHMNT